jgi:Bacterial Ig-like domain (group 3)/FG-GAP-like repeat
MYLRRATLVMLGVCLFLWGVLPTVRSQSGAPPQRGAKPQIGNTQAPGPTAPTPAPRAPALPPGMHMPPALQHDLAHAAATPSRNLLHAIAHPFDAQPAVSSSPIFLSAAIYGSGGHQAYSVAVGDFNNDGKIDIAVTNFCGADPNCQTDGGVSVLLGNGDGTYQAARSYDSNGVGAYSVTVGDFNGDGKPDLAVANQCSDIYCSNGGVSILLGNGDGTFQPAQSYSSGGLNAYSVTVGDFNGDGKPDLVVANECEDQNCTNGGVSVLLGNGDGTFQAAQSYASGGISANSVIVGDFNKDGKVDLAVTNQCAIGSCSYGGFGSSGNGAVGVLLGNGDGTFQLAQSYSSGGLNAYSVAVGDFNGDGNPDLVVANQCADSTCTSGSLSVLLGNGDGTYQPANSYSSSGGNDFYVAVGDFNGDGNLDLAVANECVISACDSDNGNGSVSVLLGNGDGTFQGTSFYVPGINAYSVTVADFNGDGKADIAAANLCADSSCANGSVGILLGGGDGTFQAAPSYVFTSANREDYYVTAGDFNGDGNVDLAVADYCGGSNSCTNGAATILLGNGDGTFQAPQSYVSGGLYAATVTVGDFNGDGILDLAVGNSCADSTCQNGSVTIFIGRGDGTFQEAQSYASGGVSPESIAVADFNLDGKVDLAVANGCGDSECQTNGNVSILLGNGDGTFQPAVSYVSGGSYVLSVVVGDFNGDGKADLAMSNDNRGGDGSVSVLLGNGDGTFQALRTFDAGGLNTYAVTAGDFNHDGRTDLAAANECVDNNCTNSSVTVLLGNGDGTFQPPQAYAAGFYAYSVIARDFNGDGATDLFVGDQAHGGVVLLGNGDGTFQTAIDYGVSGPTTAVTAGDFNNDGKPDLAIVGAGTVAILQNISTNFHYATTSALTSSANPSPANQPVTFTATVTPGFNLGALTGTVTFSDGGSAIGTAMINGGTAAFTTSSLSLGAHSITAAYSGDSNYAPSVSTALTETINSASSATTTTIAASPNPSAYGQSVNLTATVTSASTGTPTGSVTFMDGANNLGSGAVSGGMATLITAALGVGSHSITANYSGDSNFSASSSSAVSVGVNQATSTIGLSSSVNPSISNQAVAFTATIMPQYGGAATGTVTFKDGATSIGSAGVNTNTASLTLGTLAVGTHSITVVYSGDGNVSGSSSSAISQVVNKQTSTSLVTSSTNPAIAGSSITFTITVSPQLSGTPTGTVTLKKNGGTLATLSLNSGQATYMTSSLGIGSFSIMAVYAGDSNFSSSTSPVLTQVVGKASTTTAVTSSLNPSNVGQAVTFTANVGSSSGAPADGEVVAFKNGGATIGSAGLSGGIATFATSSLTAGAHSITAVYSGDATFSASTSATLTQTVSKYGTTSTLTSSGSPNNVGQPVTFTATVSSSGGAPPNGEIVTFKNGGATLGTGALSGGSAGFTTSSLAAGSHSISAVYSGDTTFLASTSTTVTQMVDKYSTASQVMSNDGSTNYGQAATFTATVTSNSGPAPTGLVVFKNGAATLGTQTLSGGTATLTDSALAVGTRTITVVYNGDANNAGSTSPAISQVVAKAATTTTLTSSGNPSTSGTAVRFTATVSSSTTGTPTGFVTFKSGTTVLGTATLSGGTTSVITSSLTPGPHTITATYNGNADFVSSSATLTQRVQ